MRRRIALITTSALTVSLASATLASASPGVEASTQLRASLSNSYLKKTGRYVVSDMRAINSRLNYGDYCSAGSRLNMLSDSYYYMGNSWYPRSSAPVSFRARLATLSNFAEQAADDLCYGSVTAGLAKYQVIKKETNPVLRYVNSRTGTYYRVP